MIVNVGKQKIIDEFHLEEGFNLMLNSDKKHKLLKKTILRFLIEK